MRIPSPVLRLLCLFCIVVLFGPVLVGQQQYLVINIAPEEDLRTAVREIVELKKQNGSPSVRLGAAAIWMYLRHPREQVVAELNGFLAEAERNDLPVVIQLDGEQWWQGRPDLWNWWDPSRPGYDTANRQNVEWSGWGPEHALKISWRNWGAQLRVLPPPNFMSARYRAACHEEMTVLVPVIMRWWKALPPEKKDLLIGIKLGWESAIGVNSYYYPGGNALLDSAEALDPRQELKGEEIPGRGMMAIGYAAVSTAGLAHGGELQEAHLAEIVRRHLDDLCALAARLGVPRERLFTHVGGWKDGELLYDAAVNRYSCPGWSFYRYAPDVGKDEGVRRAFSHSEAPWWAAVEWFWFGDHPRDAWLAALRASLADPRCRYMCVYNWNGIRSNAPLMDALRHFLSAR